MSELIWADVTDMDLMDRIADFFSAEISTDDSYVSHGEIQTGLSEDGVHWSPQLAQRMREDLRSCGEERSVLTCTHEDELVGASIIAWEITPRVSFCVIEDMAVKSSVRSHGVGGAMIAEIEAEARRRDMAWAFLESGLGNHGAHEFFKRHAFRTMSKVFAKAL